MPTTYFWFLNLVVTLQAPNSGPPLTITHLYSDPPEFEQLAKQAQRSKLFVDWQPRAFTIKTGVVVKLTPQLLKTGVMQFIFGQNTYPIYIGPNRVPTTNLYQVDRKLFSFLKLSQTLTFVLITPL